MNDQQQEPEPSRDATMWPEPRCCFPGIRGGYAEDMARTVLARANDAVFNHEADGIWVDVDDAAILCIAVLSVGNSSRPDDATTDSP